MWEEITMSAFLGHIHHWLYNKISRVAEREQLIYEKAEEMCGATAEELREQVWQIYGTPQPDAKLEEIIDHNNEANCFPYTLFTNHLKTERQALRIWEIIQAKEFHYKSYNL